MIMALAARSAGLLSGSAAFTADEPELDDLAGARTLNG
jgi:hypothetical protein